MKNSILLSPTHGIGILSEIGRRKKWGRGGYGRPKPRFHPEDVCSQMGRQNSQQTMTSMIWNRAEPSKLPARRKAFLTLPFPRTTSTSLYRGLGHSTPGKMRQLSLSYDCLCFPLVWLNVLPNRCRSLVFVFARSCPSSWAEWISERYVQTLTDQTASCESYVYPVNCPIMYLAHWLLYQKCCDIVKIVK